MIKKYSYRVIFFIGIVLIIVIPTIKILAEKNDTLSIESNTYKNETIKSSNDINILEIQPGNSFTILSEKLSGVYKYNDSSIVVHHISMPEFIGNISELNGMYDIIIIGNKSNNENKYSKINYGTGEINPNNDKNWGIVHKEYNENDITKRKADEIIKFINTGQLVYINDSIIKDNSIIEGSNLYNKFKSISKDNFIKYTSESSLTIDSIIKKYQDSKNKRFKINTVTTGGDSISSTETNGDIDSRSLNFKVSPDSEENIGAVTINLYLDINGDGLFKEKEIYKTLDVENFNSEIDINYQMDYEFIGEIFWKIEVIKKGISENEIKSYNKGSFYFKSLSNNKKSIRVLQILSRDTNLDLSGAEFKEIIRKQNDYDIVITTKTYLKYNEEIENKTLSLNGKYDMVILGFQDEYGVETKGAQLTDKGINELKTFIASGQSVMFTHDTIPGYDGNINKNLSAAFRTYVGQARFLTNDTKTSELVSNPNNYKYIEDLYKEYNVVTGQYETRYIPTLESYNKEINGYSFWSSKTSARQQVIYETNEGLITNYPFDITNDSKKFMQVALTHHQYFQLDLEDEDIVPWYNLTDYTSVAGTSSDGSNVNKYDSRNFYYTYSKGNITYSGTGHSGGYTDDELKLFVNTIVKAERGANHAPTLDSNVIIDSEKEYDLEIDSKSDYTFTVIPRDIDNDNVKVSFKVYLEGDEGNIVQKDSFDFQKQGIPRDITIEHNKWKDYSGKIILVEVEVEDIRGAKYTQIYRFMPTINSVSVSGKGEGLVGEEITIPLDIDITGNIVIDEITSKIESEVFEEVKINKYNDGKEYELKVKTNTETLNEIISLKVNYQINKIKKEITVGIPINTKAPIIEVKVIDINQDLGSDIPNIELKNTEIIKGLKSGNSIVWNNNTVKNLLVTSECYNINIENTNSNYKINSMIKRDENEGLIEYRLGSNFEISYNNPKAYIEISLEKNVRNISHGLYNEIKNSTLYVTEGSVNLARGSIATVAIGFSVASKDVNFAFEIDNNIKEKETLGLYKIDGNELKKISNIDDVNHIKLPDNITSKTKLVILYRCKIPSIDESNKKEFINRIFINAVC